MATLANEIRSARTINSKQLILPVGGRKIIASIGAKHYRDEKGRLYDIDPDALAIKDDTDEYFNHSLPFIFTLHRLGIGYTYVSRTGGQITITLTAIGDSRIDQSGDYKVTRGDGRLTFHDVATDTDIMFELHRNGLRTYRVLRSDKAPREWRWAITGDDAGLAKVSSRIAGRDASGKELAGLVMEAKDGNCLESWDGTTVVQSPDRLKSLSRTVAYPVIIDPDITESISSGLNDSQVSRYGYPNPYVTQVQWWTEIQYRLSAFFRFLTVPIDQGESIALAELILNVTSASTGTIFGLDYDSAPAVTSLGGWQGATRTTASTAFNPGGTGVQAFDVTAQVQEIVDRGGWSSGNDMGFIIDPVSGFGAIEDYSDPGTDEAKLEITLGGSASNRRRRLLLGT